MCVCAAEFFARTQQKATRAALHAGLLHMHNRKPNVLDCMLQFCLCTLNRKLNVLDCMLEKMEQYSNNLEQVIAQRTTELMEEKEKTDQLLYRMLPRCVYVQPR